MEPVERKRGGCLTAWLILMLIANPLVALQYLAAGGAIRQNLPNLPAWALPVLALFAFANFAFAFAIWKWRRWGMYGFVGSSAIVFMINLAILGAGMALLGLLGVVLLAFLLRPVWNQMD